MSTRKRYSDEFKVEAVKLTESSAATIATIAKELGVSVPTLNEWRAKAKRGKLRGPGGKVVSFNDATEMQRLKRENARLKKEVEILKSAAVGLPHHFFAKESL
jgi:transposase